MIKKMFIYFLGTTSSALISFLFLPLYTSSFDVEEFGIYDLTQTLVIMIVSVVFMELWTGLIRFIIDIDSHDESSVISNVLLINIIMIVPFLLIFYILTVLLGLPNFWIYSLFGLSLLLQNLYQYYLRSLQLEKAYVISGISLTVFQTIFNLILILIFNFGVISIIISQVSSRLIVFLVVEIKYKFFTKFKFSLVRLSIIRNIIVFSIPFSVNAIAFWGMTNVNRLIAKLYLQNSANGYIAVASKFVAMLTLITSVYILSWQEESFRNAKNNNKDSYFDDSLNNLIVVACITLFILIPFTKVIFPFMVDEKFNSAFQLIPLYYIATFFSVINGYFGQIFGAIKKTKALSYSTFLGAIVNIFVLLITVRNVGILSIPIALSIGTFANVILRYFLVKKHVLLKLNGILIITSFIFVLINILYVVDIPFTLSLIISSVVFIIFVLFNFKAIYAIVLESVKFVKILFRRMEEI